jgi:Cu/Ag efflux protein CusF
MESLLPLTRRIRNYTVAAIASTSLSLAAGCAQTPPKPVEVVETVQATATVEAIDMASRLVTLKTADGRIAVIQAGPEVRNLPQVRVGDRVVVRYHEAIMAEVVAPGTGTSGVTALSARAEPGERPAGMVANEVKTVVKVYEVDTVANVVEVTGPAGYNRRIKVKDPKAQAFIRGLKPGDEVQVTFTEAFAISVEPAK